MQTVHSSFTFSGNLRLRRKLQRQILRGLGLISVAISQSVETTELAHFGLKTRLVPNWYDSNSFAKPTASERQQARDALGIAAGETVIVTVGNCSQIKNHEALMQALAMLPAAFRPLYLYVGIEEPDHPEQKLAQELGIAERVRFIGALRDVRPALYASDIFVMPSLVEGFGISAVEALVTGLPAVFTDVSGLRDFRDVYDGLCYAKPDAISLHDALLNMLTESHEHRRLRADGYPAISKRIYGIERGIAGYLEIYHGT